MATKEVTETYYVQPNRCIEQKRPTAQSVLFCGVFINLTALAIHAHLTPSYLSMIFAGKRNPSLKTARRIALGLNMDFGAFVNRLDEHVSRPKPYINIKIINKKS